MATTTRATELQRLFQNMKTAVGGDWEAVLLENARSVSSPLATRMLLQMGLGKDTNTPFRVLENACGAGILPPLLQQTTKPDIFAQSSIVCSDFSEQVVDLAKRRIESEGWPNTEAAKVDAQVWTHLHPTFFLASQLTDEQNIGFADGSFTHVATNLGFHVVPDSEVALNGNDPDQFSSRQPKLTRHRGDPHTQTRRSPGLHDLPPRGRLVPRSQGGVCVVSL